jgi:DNA-binding HxlR family transcriptional regulator
VFILLICKLFLAKNRMSPKSSRSVARRSPCPIACALDTLGDKWTLLVIRDLFLGRKRFKDFCASPEKIPTNILSDRLNRLVDRGLVQPMPLEESPGRQGYALTEKGLALESVIRALLQWGLEWEPETAVMMQRTEA